MCLEWIEMRVGFFLSLLAIIDSQDPWLGPFN